MPKNIGKILVPLITVTSIIPAFLALLQVGCSFEMLSDESLDLAP